MTEDQNPDITPLVDALDQATEAQVRYDLACQLAAEGKDDVNPTGEHIRFQQYTIGLFKRLRPYLRHELPRYWEEAILYSDAGEDKIVGLKQLHYYQGTTISEVDIVGGEAQTREEAGLMPPAAVRNALDLLAEAMYELQMLPSSGKRRRAANASVSEDDDADPARVIETDG